MSLMEQVYSVLLVSSSEKISRALREIFSVLSFSPFTVVGSVGAAERAAAEREFDLIIVNSPLPDDGGLRFSVDAADRCDGSVVLFLAREEQYDEVWETLVSRGVFTLRKPLSKNVMEAASDWLISARERIRRTEKKTLSIEEKMNEIRLVNRAKWLLISELKMTESDAHRYIEKQAMDRCIPKRRIAEEIIKTYS